MQDIQNVWQLNVLDLITSGNNQDNFWHDFLKQCLSYRENAWPAWQKIQGVRVIIKDMPSDLDVESAIEELRRAVWKGKNPSSFFARITLSKGAKLIFDSVKIDGYPLLTIERIDTVNSYLTYKKQISKIDALWNKTIRIVDGPKIDLTGPMPLTEVDRKVKDIASPIEWKDKYFEKIERKLIAFGYRKQIFHKREALEECLRILHGQEGEIEKRNIEKQLSDYRGYVEGESSKKTAHDLWKQLSVAVAMRSIDKYEQAYTEAIRLQSLCEKVQQIELLLNNLKAVTPVWASQIEKRARADGEDALDQDWQIAWMWRRLEEWLKRLHQRESTESLQNRLERARKREQELISQLVNERTWQRQIANVKDYHYRALVAWADAMRRYGRTGGKYAQRLLSAATKAMVDAVGAVPAWIMPLHRVVQSFPAEAGIFDLIIIDEASQCDIRALPVLFRAKKVLVVGDPEQISPAAIGIEESKVFELGRQFLSDIPYADTTFTIKNSLYQITQNIPRMDRILLTEHFRCVPEIIEFNNRLCRSYAGKLEPLRQANPRETLDPTIKTIFVENGFKDNNDINKPEAEALVELLVKCCKDNRYSSGGKDNRKRTMGIISLLGEKQAKYISELIAQRIEETERAERRIICGDAYAFQGDERDVMFLSMVIATNAQFAPLVKESDRQRFNVATSRARDQVFLFHSVKLNNIKNPECVRYKLTEWYLNPPLAEIKHGIEVLRKKAETDFEIEVGERIIKRGYRVIPQFKPMPNDFNYKIDLVVQGEKNRVAVECDGDRYHGPDQWERDQRRETQLRRAGWKFWRVSGSTFYRNKERSLEGLWQFLENEGIRPEKFDKVESENQEEPVFTSPEGEGKTETSAHYESMDRRGEGRKNDKDFETRKDKEHGKSVPFGGKDTQANLDSSRVTSKLKTQQIDL